MYLQQVDRGFICKAVSPAGWFSHFLFILFSQLHVDFFSALGYTYLAEFLSGSYY